MYSELLEASNGDKFFISKSEEGSVEVKILKLGSSKSEIDDNEFEKNYDSYPIPEDSQIKNDVLR